MTPTQKNRTFKILSAVIVLALLIRLYWLMQDVHNEPGANAYALNDSINNRNRAFAALNPFGFTDRIRTVAKPKGIFRIAVLGDSFVWGDGLPYEQAWGHKLEQKILAGYDSVEVMNWGKSGWSTLDEFNFYKEHGKDYDVDLVIIGWVDNDPDLGTLKQIPPADPEKVYPVVSRILPVLAKRWVNKNEVDAYNAWTDSLYTEGNLKAYEQLIDTMQTYFESQHTRLLFALTPGSDSLAEEKQYVAIAKVFDRCGKPYLNLHPGMFNKLPGYSKEQLRANPVNGHPGPLMTEECATEVLAYLKANGYLSGLHTK